MKITKSYLREVIKEEISKEIKNEGMFSGIKNKIFGTEKKLQNTKSQSLEDEQPPKEFFEKAINKSLGKAGSAKVLDIKPTSNRLVQTGASSDESSHFPAYIVTAIVNGKQEKQYTIAVVSMYDEKFAKILNKPQTSFNVIQPVTKPSPGYEKSWREKIQRYQNRVEDDYPEQGY